MTPEPLDDIVRLATAPNPAQAHIWEQALRQAGVRCKVVGDYLDAGIGDIPGLRAEIWVHKEDVTHAEEILREMLPVTGAATDEEE
jgi:Putative prokaryotic signal transducing protein